MEFYPIPYREMLKPPTKALVYALHTVRWQSKLIFFRFPIKPGKTKQIVVALIATTRKALLSVAKTNVRLAGRKLYAGNIYNLFGFTHIFPHKKGAQPKPRTEKHELQVVAKRTYTLIGIFTP